MSQDIIFNRQWAMPSHATFSIKPIKKLINRYYDKSKKCLNPFAFKSEYGITNDINPSLNTDYNLDATEFLKLWEKESIDLVLYDPPYTPTQLKEHYNEYPDSKVLYYTSQTSYWSNQKDIIKDIVKPNGIVISFGYDTQGIGKTRGFEIIEILIVSHGGGHNDTLCTVERKINQTKLI